MGAVRGAERGGHGQGSGAAYPSARLHQRQDLLQLGLLQLNDLLLLGLLQLEDVLQLEDLLLLLLLGVHCLLELLHGTQRPVDAVEGLGEVRLEGEEGG